VKEVAQIGAVIGREFAHDLLAAVSPLPGDELTGALDQLVAAELIFRRGTPPHRRRSRLPDLRRVLEQAGFEVERTTYANITFFLPILLIRKLMRLTGIKAATENNINVPALNGLLGRLFGAESTILRYLNLPFGVSGLCIAVKK
jgi:hypothetical protein